MAISIRGVTKHANGATVRGYEQGMHGGQLVRESPNTHSRFRTVSAVSGTYRVHGKAARIATGVAPHGRYPANRKHTVVIAQLSDLIKLSATSEWTEAVQEALDHINLVLHNNPTKDLADILPRPDIQEALQTAGTEGSDAVIEEIKSIWEQADAPEDSPYLAQVIQTMTTNGDTFASRMTEALQTAKPDQAMNILSKDKLRAAAAESVIRTRAKNEHALTVMTKAGVTHVQWQARTIPGTDEFQPTVCSTCRALHGTVANIGSSFDVHILQQNGIKPYGDLISPPAHPNCQCRLVPAKG